MDAQGDKEKKEDSVLKKAPNFLIRSSARCNKVVTLLHKQMKGVHPGATHLLKMRDLSGDGHKSYRFPDCTGLLKVH